MASSGAYGRVWMIERRDENRRLSEDRALSEFARLRFEALADEWDARIASMDRAAALAKG